ncbi:MAG: serine/threonine protein kinase [Myxococcales bacterium]|nr:serine/threonine protein kinase [Myxococcales bacterium]
MDPTVMRAQTRVGTVLRGKWRLDVLLGVGGMAAVYAATHRNGTRAALKILHPELSTHSHIRSRFFREGRAANTVGHPGAVKVIDEDEAEDGSVFLVMELLDGEHLDARAARSGGKLPVDEVLSAADQILDVLVAAHAKGMVHRDLKPENVFLTRDGQIRVLDFGIARLRELSTASNATREGTSMGTPSYMPPEQARALWDEVDGRSDLWAVGALMFAMLTGRAVHEGRTTNEVLLSAMTKPAPRLLSVEPGVHRAVGALVDRALAFERDARWPDARAMQEALRFAYQDMNRAPISTAPKLTVPPSVANRTLASADVAAITPGMSSDVSAMPVATGRTGTPLFRTVFDRPVLAAVGGVGVALAFVLTIGIALLVAKGAKSPAAPATTSEQPSSAAVSAPTQVISVTPALPAPPDASAPAEPVVALDDLPTAKPGVPKLAKPDAGGAVKAGDWKEQRR